MGHTSVASELRHMLREDPAMLRERVDTLIAEARNEATREFWREFRRFLDVALNPHER